MLAIYGVAHWIFPALRMRPEGISHTFLVLFLVAIYKSQQKDFVYFKAVYSIVHHMSYFRKHLFIVTDSI